MGKPKAPEAPDPQETAAAQTGTNVSTAIANANLGNVNQVTPYGNLNYSKTGSYEWTDPSTGQKYNVPTFTATTTLSPEQQKILDQNNQTNLNLSTVGNAQSARLGELLSTSLSLNDLPKGGDASKLTMPNYQQFQNGPQLQTDVKDAGAITKTYGTDFSADRQRVEDALFARANPQLEKDRANLETSLVNQGVRRGSDAWATAMDEYNRSVNDQRTSILLNAGQEQTRLANLEAQRAGFENAAQQQQYQQNYANAGFGNSAQQQMFSNKNTVTGQNNALQDANLNAQLAQFNAQNQQRSNAMNEAFATRNQGLNEVIGLATGAQVQSPSFVNTNMPSIPTTDYAGIVNQGYQNELGAYNSQMSQYNSILGGLFGLGAAGIKASDRRLKRDVRRVGTYRNGLPKYAFRYHWSDRQYFGVMSDDVRKVRPDAVVRIDGYDAVNYRKALA